MVDFNKMPGDLSEGMTELSMEMGMDRQALLDSFYRLHVMVRSSDGIQDFSRKAVNECFADGNEDLAIALAMTAGFYIHGMIRNVSMDQLSKALQPLFTKDEIDKIMKEMKHEETIRDDKENTG